MGKNSQWIPTTCLGCFCQCGVKVQTINRVVREIKGDEDNPLARGKLCAKGHSRIMSLYNPYRITRPVKRTTPEKGLGIDPKWVEISWEEALATVAERLEKIRRDDPRKLVLNTFDWGVLQMVELWATAFGTPNAPWVGYYCGNALHPISYLINGTFHISIDFDHCDFCLEFGSQQGFMAGANSMYLTQKMAEARARGMKLVVVDPAGCTAAAKAEEWIPIRPGTDAALALAMVNQLVNELGIYDREFLAQQTNAPYLVDQAGLYLRDELTGKPLVWEESAGRPVPYDEARAPAIEGRFNVEDRECVPAFQRLKEHVRRYTPEMASQITTIPAETIKRLAREYGQAARVGSLIEIEGHKLPLRPAAVHCYRGSYAHKHGTLAHLAIQLLNLVTGSIFAVGGAQGAHPISPYWQPGVGPDGLLVAPKEIAHLHTAYPPSEASRPEDLGMHGLFPIADNVSPATELAIREGDKFGLLYAPEMLITCRTNLLMSRANPQGMAQALKKIPFIVALAPEINETAEFADILLPDTHDMERLDVFPNQPHLYLNPTLDHWYLGVRQPASPPPGETKNWLEVLVELAYRAGFAPDLFELMNIRLKMKPGQRLDPAGHYTWEEIADRWAQARMGDGYNLTWLRDKGFFKEKKKTEEMYPRPFVAPRFPIYFEYFHHVGKEVEKILTDLGLKDWDLSDYQELPDWKPCPAFSEKKNGYDLYVVNFKIPYHTLSYTIDNPWLHEIFRQDPYASKIWIHTATAREKGIVSGEWVTLESPYGKVRGQAKVTECVHPEVVGVAGIFGHWAHGRPVGQHYGAHFNSLLPRVDLDCMDMLSTGVDACVRVKLFKG